MGTINEEYISVENLKHERFAPIVLFVYNRPWHTQQTVEALQKNVYAAESELIIYADAAKNAQAEEKVQEVREYIKSITGFKSVEIIEQKTNQGLANSIINGVTEVVNKYGRIIVLEDDIVTSKWFLKYMNDALEVYKDEEKVMQVGGFLYPIKNESLIAPFFSRKGDCWGWGTWKRGWMNFEREPEKLANEFSKEDIYQFNFENTFDYWAQVELNILGKIYTWAIFWAAIIYKKKGFVLYPNVSMTKNIGLDNSGVHCGRDEKFIINILSGEINKFPLRIAEDIKVYELFKEFFRKNQKSIAGKIINKIKKILRG